MPDIAFVTSIIGGGKSLNGTRILCDELENGDRFISTSLPIFLDDHWVTIKRTKNLRPPPGIPSWWEPPYAIQDVDGEGRPLKSDSMRMFIFGLATWCHYEIQKPVDLNQRLRLLKHDEISKFYLHVPNRDLPELQETLPGRKAVSVPDLTARNGDGGCVFIIDEIHNYFSARNYLEAGPGVERYQSQLRKLNDEMWMISQHLEKVDKNFRRNATLTYEMKNMGKQKLWGGVTLNERFNWAKFPGIPSKNDKPTETGHFMLRERGMCWLYDTMAGVGVTGGMKADHPKKGRHWSYWIFIAICICAAAFVLPRLAMKSFGYGVGGLIGGIQTGVTKGFKKHTPLAVSRPVETNHEAVPLVNQLPSSYIIPDSNLVFCTGYVFLGGNVTAFLSDGSQLTSKRGEIKQLRVDSVLSGSRVYPLKYAHFSDSSVAPSGFPIPQIPFQQTVFGRQEANDYQPSVSVTFIGQSYLRKQVPRYENGFVSQGNQNVHRNTQASVSQPQFDNQEN